MPRVDRSNVATPAGPPRAGQGPSPARHAAPSRARKVFPGAGENPDRSAWSVATSRRPPVLEQAQARIPDLARPPHGGEAFGGVLPVRPAVEAAGPQVGDGDVPADRRFGDIEVRVVLALPPPAQKALVLLGPPLRLSGMDLSDPPAAGANNLDQRCLTLLLPGREALGTGEVAPVSAETLCLATHTLRQHCSCSLPAPLELIAFPNPEIQDNNVWSRDGSARPRKNIHVSPRPRKPCAKRQRRAWRCGCVSGIALV